MTFYLFLAGSDRKVHSPGRRLRGIAGLVLAGVTVAWSVGSGKTGMCAERHVVCNMVFILADDNY